MREENYGTLWVVKTTAYPCAESGLTQHSAGFTSSRRNKRQMHHGRNRAARLSVVLLPLCHWTSRMPELLLSGSVEGHLERTASQLLRCRWQILGRTAQSEVSECSQPMNPSCTSCSEFQKVEDGTTDESGPQQVCEALVHHCLHVRGLSSAGVASLIFGRKTWLLTLWL